MIDTAQYQVTIEESRTITVRRTLTLLAASPDKAAEQAQAHINWDWQKIGERHGVILGPLIAQSEKRQELERGIVTRAQEHAAIYSAWARQTGDRQSTLYHQELAAHWAKKARMHMRID